MKSEMDGISHSLSINRKENGKLVFDYTGVKGQEEPENFSIAIANSEFVVMMRLMKVLQLSRSSSLIRSLPVAALLKTN